jgi:hypothetical protein
MMIEVSKPPEYASTTFFGKGLSWMGFTARILRQNCFSLRRD